MVAERKEWVPKADLTTLLVQAWWAEFNSWNSRWKDRTDPQKWSPGLNMHPMTGVHQHKQPSLWPCVHQHKQPPLWPCVHQHKQPPLLLDPNIFLGGGGERRSATVSDSESQGEGLQQTRLFNIRENLINPPSTQAFWPIDSWHHVVIRHWLDTIRASDSACC